MSQYWNKRTQGLQPYVPGEQPQDQAYIKLNTNENPYAPSKKVLDAMHTAVESGLNLYPDPQCRELKQAIATQYEVAYENVFVGNGSDEVLAHIFAGLFAEDKPLVCPDISYSFYPVYAQMYGIELQKVPLNNAFEIELENYPTDNGGAIFANPNAPTSIALKRDEIEKFLKRNQETVVVVDEAYVDFGGESCVPLVAQYDNLLVVKTVSKSRSLAGLRVGYAIGSPELIEGLERVKNSFNSYPLDKVALAGAKAAMEDQLSFDQARNEIMQVRARTAQALQALGFDVLSSKTNFLFASPKTMPAEKMYLALKEAGVLVRYFNQPRISEYLRITVGTAEEMQVFLGAVEKIINT
ncbi:MAG: histidinol-phosphate transaminase [Arenicellales bacterium]